jgi:hypothetical protein
MITFQFTNFLLFLDDSDNPTGKVDHLPRRILSAIGERRKRRKKRKGRVQVDADTEDEEEPAAENIRAAWSRTDPGKVGSRVRDWVKPTVVGDGFGDEDSLAGLTTAYDFYKLFQSDAYVEQVIFQARFSLLFAILLSEVLYYTNYTILYYTILY